MQEVGTASSAAKTFIENGLSPAISVKARNQNLHAETVDVVRLFFLYQDNIETRLLRIKKGNEMALEFLAQINEQIVGLSELAEELEGPSEGRPSQRDSSKQAERLNYLIKPQQVQSQLRGQFSHVRSQTYNGSVVQRESNLANMLVNRTAEDLRQSQMIADLVEKKESVVSEIHRSQAALEFILNYLQGMSSGHIRRPHQASVREYSSWLVDNLDVQDFLEETYKFFHQVSRVKTHTPGASGSSAGFGAEKNGSQSDTPKGIKSTATSGQGPFSQTQMSPSENHNSFLPQIAKLKRESEQKTLEINNLNQDKEELREQCARLAEKYNSLESLANKLSKERDELLQQTRNREGRASDTEREITKLRSENSSLHENIGQLRYELNAAHEQLEKLKQNLESLDSQLGNRTKELQEARNAYIILEAAYKELLADFTEFRSRELLGESTKNQADTTFKEIGLILAALEEKNDWLENQNSSLNQRNTYLEERMSQLNQAMADLVRERCLLKKQLVVQEVNRGKKPDADGLDQEMQKYLKDEAYLIQDENLKLNEDVELLRRRIESLSSENKHLHQQNGQLKSKLAGKPRSSSAPRRRESLGPIRQDSDRSFQYQRGSPNGSILDGLKDPHSTADEPDVDYLCMLATQAMWLSKAVESGAL